MKKLGLLLGALGGAMAGYLFSKPELRKELKTAKSPEEAGEVLAKHLKQDGKKVGHEVQEFVKSQEVQQNLSKAKGFVQAKFKEAKSQVQGMMKKGKKEATKAARKARGFVEERV